MAFLWSLLLGAVLLGPALGPGFLLAYDLVWVPDLALRGDFLGVGSALPRAVPSDAVVALVDEVIPGILLEKLMLIGAVMGGGAGMARLLREQSQIAQLVAVGFYVWSPFVVERLLLGAWPVLLGYAVLPWVLLEARRWRESGALPAVLPVLIVVGSLSASSGLVTAIALLATAAPRADWRRWAGLSGLLAGANAPWVVSGLLHVGSATSDPAAARLFALSDEGVVPGPLAALTGGGIWNSEVVPPSRAGILGLVALLLFLVLATMGMRTWVRALGRRDVVAWSICWMLGWGAATLTWAVPSVTAALAADVPGGGLFRDGSRLLVLAAPATAALMGMGVQRVVGSLSPGVIRTAAGALLVVAPIILMPDAGYGVGGRLDPVDYPASYVQARDVLHELSGRSGAGDVLLLPLSSYRQPTWNNSAKVLDPLGRYLTPDYVASDELIVAGSTLGGEDPRVPQVRKALAASSPQQRSAGLADLGIGFVAIDPEVTVEIPEIVGDMLVDAPEVRLIVVDPDLERRGAAVPTSWVAAMAVAWSGFLAVLLTGLFGRPARTILRRMRKLH